MTPHDLVNWSLHLHNSGHDADLDDAAGMVIEKYTKRQHMLSFESDTKVYAYLNVCCRRVYRKIKAKRAKELPIETAITKQVDDSEEDIRDVEQLKPHFFPFRIEICK